MVRRIGWWVIIRRDVLAQFIKRLVGIDGNPTLTHSAACVLSSCILLMSIYGLHSKTQKSGNECKRNDFRKRYRRRLPLFSLCLVSLVPANSFRLS